MSETIIMQILDKVINGEMSIYQGKFQISAILHKDVEIVNNRTKKMCNNAWNESRIKNCEFSEWWEEINK